MAEGQLSTEYDATVETEERNGRRIQKGTILRKNEMFFLNHTKYKLALYTHCL